MVLLRRDPIQSQAWAALKGGGHMNVRQLIAAGVIGAAVVGMAVGFVTRRAGGFDFFDWVTYERSDAISWRVGGLTFGIAATFLRPE
jgi:hypothetical protein